MRTSFLSLEVFRTSFGKTPFSILLKLHLPVLHSSISYICSHGITEPNHHTELSQPHHFWGSGTLSRSPVGTQLHSTAAFPSHAFGNVLDIALCRNRRHSARIPLWKGARILYFPCVAIGVPTKGKPSRNIASTEVYVVVWSQDRERPRRLSILQNTRGGPTSPPASKQVGSRCILGKPSFMATEGVESGSFQVCTAIQYHNSHRFVRIGRKAYPFLDTPTWSPYL
jgi:hypothetical protein